MFRQSLVLCRFAVYEHSSNLGCSLESSGPLVFESHPEKKFFCNAPKP